MTILVTGAGGFVGRALVASLLHQGKQVTALDSHFGSLASHKNLTTITGDLGDVMVQAQAVQHRVEALVHLATVPGGAAEADPSTSRKINIDAMYDLLLATAKAGTSPRVVYASSIAVLGDHLPPLGVDDLTPISPRLVYGGHKAMMETAVAMMSNRGELDGVTVRLPGILARPKGPSGLKSAFMSDLFHALRARETFVCPVSAAATIWAQSVTACVQNLQHALALDSSLLPSTRVVTLPALHVTMGQLVSEVALHCGVPTDLVTYNPDAGLEAAFGTHPPLATPAAERAGFLADPSLDVLVERAFDHIAIG